MEEIIVDNPLNKPKNGTRGSANERFKDAPATMGDIDRLENAILEMNKDINDRLNSKNERLEKIEGYMYDDPTSGETGLLKSSRRTNKMMWALLIASIVNNPSIWSLFKSILPFL